VTGGPLVLVDAENVRRSLWPNPPPAQLVERCRAWAERQDVCLLLVFDGDGPEEETPPLTVVAARGESADRWIARRAEELRREGRRFWLVTSDRRLREQAGGGAEKVIGGGAFARELAGR
jgi:predicted RNA-binding protein with PIN domain